MILSAGLILFAVSSALASFPNVYPKIKSLPPRNDSGSPLFLTPLIEAGLIKEAQRKSFVDTQLFHGIISHSGFFTVNKKYNSNQFFWYFPPISSKNENSPVILWLQGGPGATSLYGLFTENGPLIATKKGFKRRKYTWALNHHVIYIDNPVGTGFSFTNGGFAQNETAVGNDLYESIKQFFTLFPNLQKNDFYVSGESYAGKYVPALSYAIHRNNLAEQSNLRINLKGFLIGNGLSDPIHQLEYGNYLYQIGLIDSNDLDLFNTYKDKGIAYIKEKKWAEAFLIFDDLLNGDLNNGSSLFYNMTGFKYYFNYLHTSDNVKEDVFAALLQRSDIRKALHVGNLTFNEGPEVEVNLANDIMQSVAPWVAELLSHYRGLIYNGQLDIIVAYPLTENYLKNLNFTGAEAYKTAKRYKWVVDGEIAGYVKHAGNLTEVLVRNAGHMVPADQPKWAFDLVSRFTSGKKFV